MEHSSEQINILTPDVTMMILTWATFFVLLFILKKFAWKPILETIQQREDDIRQSLLNADKTKEQLAQAEAIKAQVLTEAKAQAAQIIEDARKSAHALAVDIEHKAKLNAQESIASAQAQIEGERLRLKETLQKESVDIAVILAGKILNENTDNEHNRKLVETALKQI